MFPFLLYTHKKKQEVRRSIYSREDVGVGKKNRTIRFAYLANLLQRTSGIDQSTPAMTLLIKKNW